MDINLITDKILYNYARQHPERWIKTFVKRVLDKLVDLVDEDYESIIDKLTGVNKSDETLTQPVQATEPSLKIKSLTHISGLNALKDNQTITFCEEGVTFIYGRNGSGKTGYYKALQCLAGRTPSHLSNIYKPHPATPQICVTYDCGAGDITNTWNSGTAVCEAFKDVAFFDSSYFTRMIEKIDANEIVLRPYNFPLYQKIEVAFNYLIDYVGNGEPALVASINTHKNALSLQSYFTNYVMALKASFDVEWEKLDSKNHNVELHVVQNSSGQPCLSFKLDSGQLINDIMSDGELKGIALALFLAQVRMLSPNIPIIMDDPVNSLDTYVMENFMKRISTIPNQTIIFSHNCILLEMAQSRLNFKEYKCASRIADRIESHKRHIIFYTINSTSKEETGIVLPNQKGVSSEPILNEVEALLNDNGEHVDSMVKKLRYAIECLIDEKVFKGMTPHKFSLRAHNDWSEMRQMCNAGNVVIDVLQENFDKLSAQGLHLTYGSVEAPLTKADCKDIYDAICSI